MVKTDSAGSNSRQPEGASNPAAAAASNGKDKHRRDSRDASASSKSRDRERDPSSGRRKRESRRAARREADAAGHSSLATAVAATAAATIGVRAPTTVAVSVAPIADVDEVVFDVEEQTPAELVAAAAASRAGSRRNVMMVVNPSASGAVNAAEANTTLADAPAGDSLTACLLSDGECRTLVLRNVHYRARPFSAFTTYSDAVQSEEDIEELRTAAADLRMSNYDNLPASAAAAAAAARKAQASKASKRPAKADGDAAVAATSASRNSYSPRDISGFIDESPILPSSALTASATASKPGGHHATDTEDKSKKEADELAIEKKQQDKKRVSKWKRRRRRCVACLKTSVAFVFSHIGLCLLVMGYTVSGAYLFVYLERDKSVSDNLMYGEMVGQNRSHMVGNLTRPVEQMLLEVKGEFEKIFIRMEDRAEDSYKKLLNISRELSGSRLKVASAVREVGSVDARLLHELESDFSQHERSIDVQIGALAKVMANISCPVCHRYGGNATGSSGRSMQDFSDMVHKVRQHLNNSKLGLRSELRKTVKSIKAKVKEEVFQLFNHSTAYRQQVYQVQSALEAMLANLYNFTSVTHMELENNRVLMQNIKSGQDGALGGPAVMLARFNYTALMTQWALDLEDTVYAFTIRGWRRPDSQKVPSNQTQTIWTFPGALLYAISIITTIGYGHVAPKTVAGQLCTILYAMLGIPLMLLCLHNLGSFLADMFRLCYEHCCLRLWRRRRMRRLAKHGVAINTRSRRGRVRAFDQLSEIIPISSRYRSRRSGNRTRRSGGSSGRSGQSRYGHGSPPQQRRRVFQLADPSTGQTLDLCVLPTSAPGNNNTSSYAASSPVSSVEDLGEVIRVPVWLTLSVFSIYIVTGALLFGSWEDWGFLESVYFVFITLTTIGLGDYVPGVQESSWTDESKPITCCLYLLFGLAMIAMCFQLMQEEAKEKVKSFARKIGLLDDQ